jgi:hypothetical protein
MARLNLKNGTKIIEVRVDLKDGMDELIKKRKNAGRRSGRGQGGGGRFGLPQGFREPADGEEKAGERRKLPSRRREEAPVAVLRAILI